MVFASREDAGKQLAAYLRQDNVVADLVLGLPRGGVVVAAEVAHALDLPLDVLIVRKLGHPFHREFAVGAIAEGGIVVLDQTIIGRNPLVRSSLDEVVAEEKERLQRYQARFHRQGPFDLQGKQVLLVDDGLATGATTEAAVLSARHLGASRVLVSAPVASTNAIERLRKCADAVLVLWRDPDFDAVGRYYESFSQTTDEEVIDLLKAD